MTTRKRPSSGVRWTPDEEALLVREWGENVPRTWRQKLHGRSWAAIKSHAVGVLGLPTGTPQGHVTLNEAARRTGYELRALRAILDRCGVPVTRYPCVSDRTPLSALGRSNRHHWLCVEWDAAREAVEAEGAYESVSGGARARGVSCGVLWEHLVAEGHITPTPNGRHTHRVLSSVLDDVIARKMPSREGTLSVRAAARALGVTPDRLDYQLRRAGVLTTGRKGSPKLVDLEVARRALAQPRATTRRPRCGDKTA